MKTSPARKPSGFSLIETVIAIGVVAVLLSGFLIVFAPAAAGIKESINSKNAARLVNTLEQELVSLRGSVQAGAYEGVGFNKAYDYLKESNGISALPANALLIYQYRASLSDPPRSDDGTAVPVPDLDTTNDGERDLIPGRDYTMVNMMRRKSDPKFIEDLAAVEGPVYLVKCTQLIRQIDPVDGEEKLMLATPGQLANAAEPTVAVPDPDNYNHAVITFVADFYALPSRAPEFFESQFDGLFPTVSKPMFSRNLAVRR